MGGSKSLYNSVKAIVLANRYVRARRAAGTEEVPFERLGFVPSLARKDDLQFIRMRILALSTMAPLLRLGEQAGEPSLLRVSATTDVRSLESAIVSHWMRHCAGKDDECPWVA